MRNRTMLALAIVAIAIAGGATTLAQRVGAKRADTPRTGRGAEPPRPRLAQAPTRAETPANMLLPPDTFANPPLSADVIAPLDPAPPAGEPTLPPPVAEIPAPEPTPVEAPHAPAADPMDEPAGEPPPPLPVVGIPDPEPTPVEAPHAPAADPMAEVEAFVDRSRHEATRSIAALSREADELKDRLNRVEAALARWRQVAGALANDPAAPTAVEPILESAPRPIPIEANSEPVLDDPLATPPIERPSTPK